MKITKAMGRACLRELSDLRIRMLASKSLDEMFGQGNWMLTDSAFDTALCFAAAIAGVNPEDVE